MLSGNNMQQSTFRVVVFIFIGLMVVFYVKEMFSISPSTDRSDVYSVKVLPADLDDDALAALDAKSFSYLAMIDAGSSGCRAHVYRYGKLGSLDGPLYIVPQHNSRIEGEAGTQHLRGVSGWSWQVSRWTC
jgi:hypothetical protein